MEQLKSRPAHLAAFLHHVISQFDPAPVVGTPAALISVDDRLAKVDAKTAPPNPPSPFIPQLCYLYADFYKQTNSKETRRVFMDLHTFFIDRGAVSRPPSQLHR